MSGPGSPAIREHRVSEAFDRLAPTFDSIVLRNPINAWMRRVNMDVVFSTFSPGHVLIELGCGTGSDAVELVRRGCKVFGCDVSGEMVAAAQEKARAEGLEQHLVAVVGRGRDLRRLVPRSPWSPFDGGYANFSLTYEEDLAGVAEALASVLKPGAFFVCTLPNRIVLSEVVIYGLQLRVPDVLWRLSRPLLKDVHGFQVEIHAHSPWQVRAAFGTYFRLHSIVGLPTFLPPVYLHSQYDRLGTFQGVLRWLDKHLAVRFPWNRLGEHTLFKFQRKSSEPRTCSGSLPRLQPRV